MNDLTLKDFFTSISKFNNIKFYDEGHAYYINDKQVISVTGLLERFKYKFDTELELDKKSEKDGVPKEVLRAEWDYKREHALYEGTSLHRYLENIFANKDVLEEKNNPHIRFDQIEKSYFIMKQQAQNFYKDYILSGKLIPVKSEFVVGNEDEETAGQMDQLFWNTEVNALQVWDWKTNGKFRRFSEWGNKYKHCLKHLDECEMNGYSIQLKSYKYLFEKTTGLKLHNDCYIVWFNENNHDYEVIKCIDLDKEVEDIFEYKRNNPKEFTPRHFERPKMPSIERAVSFNNLLDLSSYL